MFALGPEKLLVILAVGGGQGGSETGGALHEPPGGMGSDQRRVEAG